jgi:hypothetical protein
MLVTSHRLGRGSQILRPSACCQAEGLVENEIRCTAGKSWSGGQWKGETQASSK